MILNFFLVPLVSTGSVICQQVIEPDLRGIATGEGWTVERSGREVGEAGPIDLLTSDGQYLGTLDPSRVRIPDAFGPNGLVAFIEKGELDIPRVEVKRLALG